MMKKLTLVSSAIAASVTMIGFSNVAQAIPSFSRQTGMACAACHTVFPELTPFGREFKLNGYTLTGLKQIQSKEGSALPKLKINEIPAFSVMLQTSARYNKGADPASGTSTTSVNFPEQLSLFYGGEISPHMGAFIQVTNSNDGKGFQVDNTDIRYANHTKLGGKDAIYGLTLNNGPTGGDVWQTTPVWGFPYAGGDGLVNNTPLIDNMAGNVAGIGGYTLYNKHLYLQGSVYKTLGDGAGDLTDAAGGSATIKGLSPYWRAAYQATSGVNYWEVGTFGIKSDLYPGGATAGSTNKYLNVGLDAQYERTMGDNNMVVRTSYIHQKADLDATAPGTSPKLKEFKLNGSYNFGNSKAVSLGYVHTSGDAWAGTDTGTNAWIAQGSYLPWQNVKLSLQYVGYTKLNGTSDNASNSNTAYLVGWFMF